MYASLTIEATEGKRVYVTLSRLSISQRPGQGMRPQAASCRLVDVAVVSRRDKIVSDGIVVGLAIYLRKRLNLNVIYNYL